MCYIIENLSKKKFSPFDSKLSCWNVKISGEKNIIFFYSGSMYPILMKVYQNIFFLFLKSVYSESMYPLLMRVYRNIFLNSKKLIFSMYFSLNLKYLLDKWPALDEANLGEESIRTYNGKNRFPWGRKLLIFDLYSLWIYLSFIFSHYIECESRDRSSSKRRREIQNLIKKSFSSKKSAFVDVFESLLNFFTN